MGDRASSGDSTHRHLSLGDGGEKTNPKPRTTVPTRTREVGRRHHGARKAADTRHGGTPVPAVPASDRTNDPRFLPSMRWGTLKDGRVERFEPVIGRETGTDVSTVRGTPTGTSADAVPSATAETVSQIKGWGPAPAVVGACARGQRVSGIRWLVCGCTGVPRIRRSVFWGR